MLTEGLTLMGTGMGTVFSFLVILWIAVSIMGNVIGYLNKIFPEKAQQPAAVITKTANNDVELAIAIAAAKYRK